MWDIIRMNRRRSALLIGVLGSVLVILGGAIGYYFFPTEPTTGIFYGCLIALVIWIFLSSIFKKLNDINIRPSLISLITFVQ